LAHQAGVARRFIDTLRDTGFESADDLSRWFARRGIHIAPSIIIAILVIVLCAASAGAVALIRYIVVHNTSRLTTNPSEQGSLPPDHRTRGTLVRIEQLKSGARMETRVAPGTIIWTLFKNELPYTRRYPDSNLNYEWTITIDGRTVKKTTTIPEVEYPNEGATYTVSVQPVELRVYEGLLRKPHVGEYRVDKEEDRGWVSGAACVWPRSGYAPRRSSPIDAAVLPGSRVRFLIRHGPAKAGDAILKFSFGDGTVWSSAEQPWTVSEARGDTWDRYQTTLQHVYSRPGHYNIRFALFRDVGKGLECLREATGQVYVDMPPPSTVPVAPRSPFPGYSFFVPPPGTTSAEDGLKVKYDPQTEPGSEFFFKFEGDNKSFAPPPQVEAVSVRNDPHFVALGVVPPPGIIPWSTYCAHVDFGVDNSPSAPLPDDAQQLGAQTMAIFNYKRGTALVGVQEFLRSGVYPITITAHPTSSRNEFLVVLRRKLHVSANAPPRVTQ
jgi:hypothetical protein